MQTHYKIPNVKMTHQQHQQQATNQQLQQQQQSEDKFYEIRTKKAGPRQSGECD